MDVTIGNNTDTTLELGDVIQWGRGGHYMVMEDSNGSFGLRNLDGSGGLVGQHSSLEALNLRFEGRTASQSTIFKAKDYKFNLERK